MEVTINDSNFTGDNETAAGITEWDSGTGLSAATLQPQRAISVHESLLSDAPVTTREVDNPDHPIAVDDPEPPIAADNPDPFIIKVHHTMMRQDLVNIYSDDSIMSRPSIGIIVNSRGKEEKGRGSGAMRRIVTLFWSEFADSSLIGEQDRVPFIRHDYNKVCSVFYDESLVMVPMLLSSLKCYVSEPEAEIVEQALSKLNPLDSKELLNSVNNCDCRRVVSPDNIHNRGVSP